MSIIKKYKKEELTNFAKMIAITTCALAEKHQDFLGSVYMSNDFENKDRGQSFTPYNLSKLLAALTNIKSEKDYQMVNDCCCGAGALVIAAHELNPKIIAICQDIDLYCVSMSFIQFTCLKIPAIIILGDTLKLEQKDQYFTPAYLKTIEIKTKPKKLTKIDVQKSIDYFLNQCI